MLKSNEKGYAVVTRDLKSCSFSHIDLDVCKKYCYNGRVIIERVPYVCGFKIRVMWYSFWKPFSKNNFLWLHWYLTKEYAHKNGKVIHS